MYDFRFVSIEYDCSFFHWIGERIRFVFCFVNVMAVVLTRRSFFFLTLAIFHLIDFQYFACNIIFCVNNNNTSANIGGVINYMVSLRVHFIYLYVGGGLKLH